MAIFYLILFLVTALIIGFIAYYLNSNNKKKNSIEKNPKRIENSNNQIQFTNKLSADESTERNLIYLSLKFNCEIQDVKNNWITQLKSNKVNKSNIHDLINVLEKNITKESNTLNIHKNQTPSYLLISWANEYCDDQTLKISYSLDLINFLYPDLKRVIEANSEEIYHEYINKFSEIPEITLTKSFDNVAEETFYKRGLTNYYSKNYLIAIKFFDLILERNDCQLKRESFYLKGLCLNELKNYIESEKYLLKAKSLLDSTNYQIGEILEIWEGLVSVYMNQNKFPDAEKHINELIHYAENESNRNIDLIKRLQEKKIEITQKFNKKNRFN